MKRALLVALLTLGIADPSNAGGPPPMYVVVDRVETESSQGSISKIRIWGSFTRMDQLPNAKFSAPVYGYIEFGAGADQDAPKWAKAARTGKAVAVGSCHEAGAFLTTPIRTDDKQPANTRLTPYPKETLELFGSLYAEGSLLQQPEVKAVLAFAKAHAEPSHGEFIEESIIAGLKEDGVPRAFVEQMAKRPDFLGKCSLCRPTVNALVLYSRLDKQPEGKGLKEELHKRLSSDTDRVRQEALRELVADYIERGYARKKMTNEQREAMQRVLEEHRKSGLKALQDRGAFCPSCDGVCRVVPKRQ